MREQRYDPEQLLVTAGERSSRIFILREGLVRLFYTTPEGRERNKAFFGAGDVTGPISAAMTGSVAPFGIQALEPTAAISADFNNLLELAGQHPEVNRLYLELLSEAFIRNERREAMLLTCNAEQRYRWLLEEQPELLQRVPQFHIASYLGGRPGVPVATETQAQALSVVCPLGSAASLTIVKPVPGGLRAACGPRLCWLP